MGDPNVNPPDDTLAAALARAGIELPGPRAERLAQYCALLWEWNARLNLTRHTDYQKFVTRDLVDSQVFCDHLRPGESVLDVGTGGGVPGVVLAILRDDLEVTLAESVGKKARAVADIVYRLGLGLSVYHGRAEDRLADHRYTTLVVRAVARLRKLLEWFRPHWEAIGRLLVIKGPAWVEERGEARHYGLMHDLTLRKLAVWPLPGTSNESVLLEIKPKDR